jgi:general secretion pathway protein A
MFEEYYQLSKTPFSRDIPTESLYQSHMLEEILGRLEYAAKRQLFAVVTGKDFSTGICFRSKMLIGPNIAFDFYII